MTQAMDQLLSASDYEDLAEGDALWRFVTEGRRSRCRSAATLNRELGALPEVQGRVTRISWESHHLPQGFRANFAFNIIYIMRSKAGGGEILSP